MENFFKKSLERVQEKMSEEMESLVQNKNTYKTMQEESLEKLSNEEERFALHKQSLERELEIAQLYDGIVTDARIKELKSKIDLIDENQPLYKEMATEYNELFNRRYLHSRVDSIKYELEATDKGLKESISKNAILSDVGGDQNPYLN